MTSLLIALVMFAAAAETPAPAKSTLSVATFNIRYDTPKDGPNQWGKRTPIVFQTIKRMDPDLMGMQEVLANQFDDLKAALPDYEFVGVGRNDGKRGGEAVPVAFKSKRFEKLAEGHFWLSETPEKVGSKGWDAALPRMATWVRLRDRSDNGRVILYANTHFDHMGHTARTESAKLLHAKLEQLREGAPVVLTGDFNAKEDQPPYAALVSKAGVELIDSYREVHAQSTREDVTFHGFKGDRSGDRIDWILHSPELKCTSSEVVHDSDGNRYPSDHYPVLSVLEFPSSR